MAQEDRNRRTRENEGLFAERGDPDQGIPQDLGAARSPYRQKNTQGKKEKPVDGEPGHRGKRMGRKGEGDQREKEPLQPPEPHAQEDLDHTRPEPGARGEFDPQ